MKKIVKLVRLTVPILLFILLLWNLRLVYDIRMLKEEGIAIKKSINEERLRREGEDFSLHMRFDSLVNYIDRGGYAR